MRATSPTVQLRPGIAEGQLEAAAILYDEAFGAKFQAAIASRDDRLQLFEQTFLREFAICANRGSELVGLAGFHTSEGSLTGGIGWTELEAHLGFFRALRAAVVFGFYERSLKPGELLMDGIAVREDHRGQGIGTRLLSEIVQYARDHAYQSVRLDVIDTNPGARRLYERTGFTVVKSESFPYLRWLFGFGGVTTMSLEL